MDNKNEHVAKWALVGCATFMLLIQTVASALSVIGYDEVVRAYAKAESNKILNHQKQDKIYVDEIKRLEKITTVLKDELVDQKVAFTLRIEQLEKHSHRKTIR